MMTDSADLLLQFLTDHATVKLIRLHWVDFSGVLRMRTVPVKRCVDMANGKSAYHLAQNCLVVPISTAPRCWPDGIEDWTLWPDWSSLMICGFRPSHASVMCFIGRSLPQLHADQDIGISKKKSSFERCPRTRLCRALTTLDQALRQRYPDPQETTILMGFELEFVLLDPTTRNCVTLPTASALDPIVGYSTISGLRTKNLDIMEEIVAGLEMSDIEVHHFHIEIAGQIEIALGPKHPLRAIDELMMAQETIKTVFLRHQLRATMTPRPILVDKLGVPIANEDAVLSGCHFHLSLNAPPDTAMAMQSDSINQSFLAGVMSKLAALCAFGLPNYDSYCRVQGDHAGEWIGWGTHNKDMPVRQFHRNRWEFRALDVTANVYLFVAAVLFAGEMGVRSELPLTMKDCQVLPSMLPDQSEEAVRARLGEFGITDRLPTTLRAAIDIAQADPDLHLWMGNELWEQYMNVKEKEIEHFSRLNDDQRRAKFLQYF